jgi:hypothetical protein
MRGTIGQNDYFAFRQNISVMWLKEFECEWKDFDLVENLKIELENSPINRIFQSHDWKNSNSNEKIPIGSKISLVNLIGQTCLGQLENIRAAGSAPTLWSDAISLYKDQIRRRQASVWLLGHRYWSYLVTCASTTCDHDGVKGPSGIDKGGGRHSHVFVFHFQAFILFPNNKEGLTRCWARGARWFLNDAITVWIFSVTWLNIFNHMVNWKFLINPFLKQNI